MVTIAGVSKSYGERDLLKEVSLQVNHGERLGLVGPNGAGKSTLMEMILGHEEPDSGEISIERNCTVGFLPQETAMVTDETVIEIAIAIAPGIVKMRRALSAHPGEAKASDDHHHELDPHSAYAEINGFQLEAKAKMILSGLSFRPKDFERPARELSGGWVMRAHLARLLVQEPDLLLLDEPTNHLDLQSLLWFQSYLQAYPGAILMVSHDREFLNSLVRTIVDLRGGQLTSYRGNYDDYLVQREANEANQLAAYKNQQKEIERLMHFVERFRAKNTKAAQAQSKLKQIERMDKIEAPVSDTSSIGFSFPQPVRSGQRVLTLKDVNFAYGQTPVYQGLEFSIERGERVVLVGPNGAGKSTLLKLLGGVLQIGSGERILGHNVRVGYYSQNRVEMLNLNRKVLEEALDTPQRVNEQFVRTLLGCFLFTGDDSLKPVKVLSGGEKSRLALVKLLLDPPNLLLMDEPTTHLDMASIEALIAALDQFQGTLIFISHDVYFIRQLAKLVVHVEHGNVRRFAGDYQYFLDKTAAEQAAANALAAPAAAPRTPPKTKEQKRMEAEERQARSKVRRAQEEAVAGIEKQISKAEARQKEITEQLQDATTYAGPQAVNLNREFVALGRELEDLHKRWEGASVKLEQLRDSK